MPVYDDTGSEYESVGHFDLGLPNPPPDPEGGTPKTKGSYESMRPSTNVEDMRNEPFYQKIIGQVEEQYSKLKEDPLKFILHGGSAFNNTPYQAGDFDTSKPLDKPDIQLNKTGSGSSGRSLYHTVTVDGQQAGTLDFMKMGEGDYHLSGAFGIGPNTLGPRIVRSAFDQFIQQNPDAKFITANRVSGARKASGNAGNIAFGVTDEGNLKLLSQEEKQPFLQARAQSMRSNRQPQTYEDILQQIRNQTTETNSFDLDRHMQGLLDEAGEKPEPASESTPYRTWWEQPLRDEQGRMMSQEGPLAETGPARFRNALRAAGVSPAGTVAGAAQPQMPNDITYSGPETFAGRAAYINRHGPLPIGIGPGFRRLSDE